MNDDQSQAVPADSGYSVRSESRLDTENLRCCKGRVADITGSGMRMIVGPKDLPQVGDIQEYTFSDRKDSLTVTGTVKWVRKPTAFTRRVEVGIEFVKLDPQTRDSIIRLAVQGKINAVAETDIHVIYPNLYQLLGLNQHASAEEIQSAYRASAKKWHPDVSDAFNATQRFEEIRQAYAILSDETKRANYDARFFPTPPSTDQQAA